MSTATKPAIFRPSSNDGLLAMTFAQVEVSIHHDTVVNDEHCRPVTPPSLECTCSPQEVFVDISGVIGAGDAVPSYIPAEGTDGVTGETCQLVADLRCNIRSEWIADDNRWATIARYSIYGM